jgi:hypothetical protein
MNPAQCRLNQTMVAQFKPVMFHFNLFSVINKKDGVFIFWDSVALGSSKKTGIAVFYFIGTYIVNSIVTGPKQSKTDISIL